MQPVDPRWEAAVGGAFALALLLSALAPATIGAVEPAVTFALFVGSGLPHGALDFWLAQRAQTLRAGPFLTSYLGLVGLFLGVWWSMPEAGLVLFLGISVLHLGEGDLDPEIAGAGPAHRWGFVIARGSLLVLWPLFLRPEVARPIIQGMGVPGVELPPELAWPVGAGSVLLHGLVLRAAPRALVRTMVIVVAFLALPPLLAFALHFGLWHSARHLAELEARFASPEDGRVRMLRWAAPFVMPPVLALTVLFLFSSRSAALSERFAGQALVGLSALTFPHVLHLAWARRRIRSETAGERASPRG